MPESDAVSQTGSGDESPTQSANPANVSSSTVDPDLFTRTLSEARRSSIATHTYVSNHSHNLTLAPPNNISPNTTRRKSFNVFTTASFLSPSPPSSSQSQNQQRQQRPRHNTQLSLPRMMTTMNMASRLAGGRVKDQTIHHSFSDRSSTHTKPAPSQDTKGTRMGGYSADGLKRISNGIGREWSEKTAPCAWEPIAITIMRLDEPASGWPSAQAFFREGLSDKLDVYVRDVRIREPNDDFKHEYELIRTAAEKAGKSDINEATIAHAEALAHTASLASLEGGLIALIRIWSELDEDMEGWIRSEMATLAEEYKDRQIYPEKYKKLKMERKAALKRQMASEKKAENARKKLELKEVKRKMAEEQVEREKMEGKKGFGIGQDGFWPMEQKEDWGKQAPKPESDSESESSDSSSESESDSDSEGSASEGATSEIEKAPEEIEKRMEEVRLRKEKKARRKEKRERKKERLEKRERRKAEKEALRAERDATDGADGQKAITLPESPAEPTAKPIVKVVSVK